MENECQGCIVCENDECVIGVIPCISPTLQCPCRICIVKIMCTGACQEFKTYLEISGNEKERLRNETRRNNR